MLGTATAAWIKPALAFSLVFFLGATSLGTSRTQAKLAFFGNKLAIAILLAAVIRTHQGWADASHGFPFQQSADRVSETWDGWVRLASWCAPLLLVAADSASGLKSTGAIRGVALWGIIAPLSATLLLIGFSVAAVFSAGYYQPSLQPNIAMALWGKAANRSLPPRFLIVSITTFCAARFGYRALRDCLRIDAAAGRRSDIVFCAAVAVTALFAWRSEHMFAGINFLDTPGIPMMCAAAILTVEAGLPRPRTGPRRFAGDAVLAMAAGIAAGAYSDWFCHQPDHNYSGAPWLLVAYAAALLTALAGRLFDSRSTALASTR